MKWIPYRLEDTRHILECMELASLQATKADGALHPQKASEQYCKWCQVQVQAARTAQLARTLLWCL